MQFLYTTVRRIYDLVDLSTGGRECETAMKNVWPVSADVMTVPICRESRRYAEVRFSGRAVSPLHHCQKTPRYTTLRCTTLPSHNAQTARTSQHHTPTTIGDSGCLGSKRECGGTLLRCGLVWRGGAFHSCLVFSYASSRPGHSLCLPVCLVLLLMFFILFHLYLE